MGEGSTKKSKGFMFLGIAAGVLITLYTVVGFWVAPYFVQSLGSRLVKEKTGLNLTFENVRLNPFRFTAVFEKMSLGRPGKTPFLTVGQLFADFEIGSLVTPPYRFRLIRLVSAEERLTVLPDGRLVYAPLFEEISKQTARSRRLKEPPEILIENMRVETFKIVVINPARSNDPIVTVSPLSGEFTNLSTVKGQKGTYDLKGTLVDIGQLRDSGRVSLAPLRLEGRFKIDVSKLRPVMALMGDAFPFDLSDGSLDLDVSYTAEKKEDGYDLEVRDGNVSLEGIKLTDKQQGFSFARLANLSARGLSLNTSGKQAVAEEIALSGAELTAWIRPDGRSGLLDVLAIQIFHRSEARTGTSTVGLPAFIDGWQARLKKVDVQKALFRYENHRNDPIETAEILSVPSFTIGGVFIDAGTKQLAIEAIVASDVYFFDWMNPDGSIGLSRVFGESLTEASGPDPESSKDIRRTPAFGGWQAQLNRAELKTPR